MRLAASLLACCLAMPAWGATYWVSPTGTSVTSGGIASRADSTTADTTAHVGTLAWFNANAIAGDVCHMKNGIYSSPVFPNHNGTASNRIRYYGNPAAPTAVTVTNLSFGFQFGSYCTAKWMRMSGTFSGCPMAANLFATNDSIVNVTVTSLNNTDFKIQGQNSVFDSLTVTGTVTQSAQIHWINLFSASSAYYISGNRVTNSTFNLTVNAPSSGGVQMVASSNDSANVWFNNSFNCTIASCGAFFYVVEAYHGANNLWQSNAFTIQMDGEIGGSRSVWGHRNGSHHNRYLNNYVSISGSGGHLELMLTHPGNVGTEGTETDNYYGYNRIEDDCVQAGGTGVIWWYDGAVRDTLEFNQILTNTTRPCLYAQTGASTNHTCDGLVLHHNTYLTGGRTAVDITGLSSVSNSPRMTADVAYAALANSAGNETVRVPSGFGLDSAGVLISAGSGSTATRGYAVGGVAGTPGSGGVYGASGSAVYADPLFVGSLADYPNMNLSLGTGSPAAVAATGWSGYAGALGTSSLTYYTITASAGAHGIISPLGPTAVLSGASQQFNMFANAGYYVSSVIVDGVAQNPSLFDHDQYVFSSVSANHTIVASFTATTVAIVASTGPNGTVSPLGSAGYFYGASATYTITPATNYSVSNVLVDGVSVGAVTSYTFLNLATDHTISATFRVTSTTFLITASNLLPAGGTILPLGATSVTSGADQAYAIAAFTDYHIADVLADGASVGAVSSYTFSAVSANHTIVANFAPDSVVVAASVSGVGGTVSVPTASNNAAGRTVSVLVIPSKGYHIRDVLVDGVSVGGRDNWLFRNVTMNHTLEASFAPGFLPSAGGGKGRGRFR